MINFKGRQLLNLKGYSLLSDREILDRCINHNMISPFFGELIKNRMELGTQLENHPVISYGLSSFGYDIRLSLQEFFVFRHQPGEITDPKKFRYASLVEQTARNDGNDEYFIVPAHSYALGVSMECLWMPRDVLAICMGKSTYARCGLIVNVTPIEPGWRGYITLEMSNSSDEDCRVYAGEGICQLLFFQGNRPSTSYADRRGKYQDQLQRVTPPRV